MHGATIKISLASNWNKHSHFTVLIVT